MPQGLGVTGRRRLPLLFSLPFSLDGAAQEHRVGGRAASDSQGHWRPNARMEGGKKLLLILKTYPVFVNSGSSSFGS